MATLQDFKIYVNVVDGPGREELFDANRLIELDLKCKFTFAVADKSGQLKFFDCFDQPVDWSEVSVKAQILYAEPLDTSGRHWKIKVRLPIKMCEHHDDTTMFFAEVVETWLDFNTHNRKGRPHDRRFVEKCMRWNDCWDKNNPGGLWFNRTIGRLR